jgi:hypothetical protein
MILLSLPESTTWSPISAPLFATMLCDADFCGQDRWRHTSSDVMQLEGGDSGSVERKVFQPESNRQTLADVTSVEPQELLPVHLDI